jgi:prepilin-type N-terminal cleavage/methylation domain-containing protein
LAGSVALPGSNEQVIFNPILELGIFIVNTTIPPTIRPRRAHPPRRPGFTMAINPTTGGSFPASVFADSTGSFNNLNISGVEWNGTGSGEVVTSGGTGTVGSKVYYVTQTVFGGGQPLATVALAPQLSRCPAADECVGRHAGCSPHLDSETLGNPAMATRLSPHASSMTGFTLIELMVTLVVATILLAIAIPSYLNQIRESRRTEAKTALLDLAGREETLYSTRTSTARCLPPWAIPAPHFRSQSAAAITRSMSRSRIPPRQPRSRHF